MQWAVRVNEAHQRLRNPLTRATYLCELAGHSLPGRDGAPVAHDILARQMHWHETLAEALSASAVKALDAEVAAQVNNVREEVRGDLDDRHDARSALPKVREWMFLARLRAEIERKLEALEAEHAQSESIADSLDAGQGPPVRGPVGL